MEGWAFTKQVADVGRGLDRSPVSPGVTRARHQGGRQCGSVHSTRHVGLCCVQHTPAGPGCVPEPDRSHSVASFRAPPGSSQGVLDRRVWVPGLCDPRRSSQNQPRAVQPALLPSALSGPPPRPLPTFQTPDAQHPRPLQCTLLPPISCCRGTAGAGGARVWCCLVICSRSGNNLKLNPQLFGSLL